MSSDSPDADEIEVLDLVRAGVLDEVPGRGVCQLTATSVRAWVTASA